MTTSTDVKWIDDFYIRIMHQKDPLTMYHKAVRRRSVQKATATRKITAKTPVRKSAKAPTKKRSKIKSAILKGCATAAVLVGISALVAGAVVIILNFI